MAMLSSHLIFTIFIGEVLEVTFAQDRKSINSLQGFHMTVATYQVSSKINKLRMLRKSLLCTVYCYYISVQEPPIFMVVRDPSNASNFVYTGYGKDTFELLSHGLNFT